MYLRNTDTLPTLEDVTHAVHDHRETWRANANEVRVDLTGDGTIILGRTEVPSSPEGLQALAQFYDVPYKFLERLPADEQQFILEHRIQRAESRPLVVKHTETGLNEVYLDGLVRLEVEDLTRCLLDVLPEESLVTDWWNTPDEFRLDVIVPEAFDRGIGGDAKVGDLTRGGVRIGQNRKQNLAPWTQTFMFRLICTNGMEVPDLGLKIDARGANEETILSLFGAEVARAFDRVEEDIAHFYDLRTVKASDDYTGEFRRMAREMGVPERTIGQMEDTLPGSFEEGEEITMFHLVNHITNQANNPDIRNQSNARRRLEQAGGTLVSDHASRCASCHSRLN